MHDEVRRQLGKRAFLSLGLLAGGAAIMAPMAARGNPIGPLYPANNLAELTNYETARGNLVVPTYAVSRNAMAALDGTKDPVVYLTEGMRQGWFQSNDNDLSAEVAIDTLQGIYVAYASDPSGADGAFVRVTQGPYNIWWFGALPGGNPVAALQCAVNLLPLSGGAVFVPAGVYRTNGTVTIAKTRVRIFGEGKGSFLWQANGATTDLFVVGDNTNFYEDITFDNLSLEGNYPTNTAGRGIVMEGTQNTSIHDCFISDWPANAIYADGTPSVVCAFLDVRGNYISGCGGSDIFMGQQCYGCKIQNNDIRDAGRLTAGKAGVELFSNQENIISANQFDANSVGILATFSGKLTIVGNFFENTGQNGIQFISTCYDSTITGNTIANSSLSSANTYDGINLNGTGLAISGNRILSAVGMAAGIRETSGSNDNLISGNKITGATVPIVRVGSTTVAQAQGIVVEASIIQSNVTGDGTSYTMVGFTSIRDTGSNFNATTGTFTAPMAGDYQLTLSAYLSGMLSGHTQAQTYLSRTGGIFYEMATINPFANMGQSSLTLLQGQVTVYLDAGDTINAGVQVSGGTKVIDLVVGSRFTARLVG